MGVVFFSYEIYLFDFDYTLGDSTGGIVASVNYALGEMGFPQAGEGEVRRTIGMSLPEIFVALTKNKEPALAELFFRLFMEKADQVMLESTELFEDAGRVLNILKGEGTQLGIVTTKYRRRILRILEKFAMAHLIDVIVGGEDVANPKPHPEALHKALKLCGSCGKNAVYIGDSIIDAQAAQRAGLDFIAVTTGTTTKNELERLPHRAIIDALGELLPSKWRI